MNVGGRSPARRSAAGSGRSADNGQRGGGGRDPHEDHLDRFPRGRTHSPTSQVGDRVRHDLNDKDANGDECPAQQHRLKPAHSRTVWPSRCECLENAVLVGVHALTATSRGVAQLGAALTAHPRTVGQRRPGSPGAPSHCRVFTALDTAPLSDSRKIALPPQRFRWANRMPSTSAASIQDEDPC